MADHDRKGTLMRIAAETTLTLFFFLYKYVYVAPSYFQGNRARPSASLFVFKYFILKFVAQYEFTSNNTSGFDHLELTLLSWPNRQTICPSRPFVRLSVKTANLSHSWYCTN